MQKKAVYASLALVVCAILAACGPSGPTAMPASRAPAATSRASAATVTAPAATATADIPAMVSALSPVVSGQGAAGAAAYDADAPGPHRILLLTQEGAYDVWNDLLPPGWRPSSAGEVELVALITRREILLGTQIYSPQQAGEPDVTVGRYRYECDVELREAQTGRTLAAETWSGTDPIPFPPTTWVTRLEGSSMEYVTLEGWLSPIVQQQGRWTQARTLEGPPGHGGSLTYSPDGRMLASGASDGASGAIMVWDTASWTLRQTLPAGSGVGGVAFSPDGRSLASASPDGTIAIWEVGGSGQSRTLVTPDPNVRSWWCSVAFSPDGRALAAGAADGRVVLWDAGSGAMARTLHGAGDTGAQQVAFSADREDSGQRLELRGDGVGRGQRRGSAQDRGERRGHRGDFAGRAHAGGQRAGHDRAVGRWQRGEGGQPGRRCPSGAGARLFAGRADSGQRLGL